MNMISKKFFASGAALVLGGATLAVSPVAPIATPAAAQSSSQADLNRAVSALRSIKTMRADFTQFGRGNQQLTGVMTLKRPGKIRFQYQKDVPVLIVSDGSRLTMIDYEVRQKQVWPVKNSPLGALLDPSGDIAKFGTLMPTNNRNVISVRIRDPKHPEYGTMTMIFQRKASAPGGLELGSWVAVDSQNVVTKVFLRNHKYGMSVDENMFRYKDISPRKKR